MALKRVIKKFARLGVRHKHREEVIYTLNWSSGRSNEKEYQFQRPGWKQRVGAEICLCFFFYICPILTLWEISFHEETLYG